MYRPKRIIIAVNAATTAAVVLFLHAKLHKKIFDTWNP